MEKVMYPQREPEQSGRPFDKVVSFLKSHVLDPAGRTQVIRFCMIGILNTIVGYGVFFLLVNYLYYLLALVFAHCTGVVHSFLWNKYWIFKSGEFRVSEFIKFNLIYAVVFLVNALALYVSVDIIHVNVRLAQLVLLPVITLVSFFGQKLWTFRDKLDSNSK
jgi:putative flippase GtrA